MLAGLIYSGFLKVNIFEGQSLSQGWRILSGDYLQKFTAGVTDGAIFQMIIYKSALQQP